MERALGVLEILDEDSQELGFDNFTQDCLLGGSLGFLLDCGLQNECCQFQANVKELRPSV